MVTPPRKQHLLEGINDAELSEEGLFLPNDHIDGHADQDFRHDIENLVQNGTQGCQPDLLTVPARVAQQPHQDAGG